MNEFVKLFLWVLVIAGAFVFLWRKGFLLRLTNYFQETREELRKCSWPSREELKGSTVAVLITIAMLGAYIVGIDFILSQCFRFIT